MAHTGISVLKFIEDLKQDKRFFEQVTEHRYIQPVEPRYGRLVLFPRLREVLEAQGISLFYRHQSDAVSRIRQGENVVIMTPTASGKSLIYNIPVLESITEHPDQKALYIFPLKGLEQDQVQTLNRLAGHLPMKGHMAHARSVAVSPFVKSSHARVNRFGEVYDGDTSAYQRKKIREMLPGVLFTNPDMLHLAINPFHRKWEAFFRNLRFVVIDEIHTYRGVFGSHVAHVLRRLRRICRSWGANPQFIAASATIANPAQLAEKLVGKPFTAISESGAPHAGRHFLFLNPADSPYTETMRLFVHCLKAGFRTIVFTKARKITELIYTWTLQQAPELEGKISPYRAGFLPRERREIEEKLFQGELLGVVSTSALELGVDIGGLDCCILCGYPGSIASTWQRAGRVGRHGQESLIAMVALQDALDQYFMRHPEVFFAQSHEAAVIDPANRDISRQHLPCAAAEVPLKHEDAVYDMQNLMPLVDELVQEKILSKWKKGDIWFPKKRAPHRDVPIRSIGTAFSMLNESGRMIGEVSGGRVFREAFPGAIYLHRGRQYEIVNLDLFRKKVLCREVEADYYTQPLSREETEILNEQEVSYHKAFSVSWGKLRLSQQITGYERKRTADRTLMSTHSLQIPEYRFETEGLWIQVDSQTQSFLSARGHDLAGSLHAVEHTAISCIPLFALCDRGDIGGLSYSLYPQLGVPATFMYDGIEGGIGLTKRALEVIGEWFGTVLEIISECPCDDGCPSCVQDPQCGSGNHPLDKAGAKALLCRWTC